MNKSLKSVIKYLIFLTIAAGLLYLAFKGNDPKQMLADLKQANYMWVILGMGCGYLAFISRGLRWNILLEPLGYKPKPWNSIHSVAVGYLANLAVPRMGEVTRCTAMNNAEEIPVDKLIGTVILERVVDLIMLALAFALAVVLKFSDLKQFVLSGLAAKQNQSQGLPTWLVVTLVGFVLFAILIFAFRKQLTKHPFYAKLKQLALGIADGFKTILKIKKRGAFIFHTISIWVLYFLMSYVYFFCLPQTAHLGVADGLFMMIVGSLGMIAPAPGGVGAFHAAAIAGLITLGVANSSAASYAVIVHSSQTLMILSTGILSLILLSLARKSKTNATV